MRKIIFYLFFSVSFWFVYSFATTTSFWKVELKEDFEKGRPVGISISERGELRIAPQIELLVDTGEPYIWALAQDQQGNIYAGTGDGGKIFKIDKKAKHSLFFDSPELEILSLTVDSKGNIYAGTSPDGLVYKITTKGEASTFFKTEENYVWSLDVDPQGNIYAGTGPQGRIYRIDPKGRGSSFYSTGEKHILCLLWTRGRLLAGSQGEGVAYRITPQGRGFVLYDPPYGEVRSLDWDGRGNVYLGALEVAEPGEGEKKGGGGGKGAVYKVSPDGRVSQLSAFPKKPIYCLILREEGELLLGSEGELFTLNSLGEVGDLAQLEGLRILCLLRGKGGEVILGTAGGGKIYKVSAGFGREGKYYSQVYDAQAISHWGRISWRGSIPNWTKLSVKTRTGNTGEPDATWSNWSPPYKEGERIKSPPARFIQFQALLSTKDSQFSPSLTELTISYLPRNRRPKVSSLKVFPPGKGYELLTSTLGAQPSSVGEEEIPYPSEKGGWVPQGLRVVKWEAEDPDEDQLRFSIYIRGKDEEEWRPLKTGMRRTVFSWDTRCFPDGTYLLKLVATDSCSNPPGTALWGEKVSRSILVDNTPPGVKIISVTSTGKRKYRVEGEVIDKASLVKELSFSLDGRDWVLLSPLDGLFDSPREGFSFPIGPLRKGEHTIVVKAKDLLLNIGTGKKVIRVR